MPYLTENFMVETRLTTAERDKISLEGKQNLPEYFSLTRI